MKKMTQKKGPKKKKKRNTNEFTYQTETDSRTSKTNLELPKRKGMGL